MEEIYKDFNKKTTDKQELILEIPENLPSVNFITDPDKLKKIFNSLLHNAIKFTPEGKISFGYKNQSDKIYFYVKDTGIGISQEAQENIFKRFMYADVETAENYGGMGLGLALSKNLVKLLGGEIGVESEPGKGSEFHFTIPKTIISSN